MSSNYLIVTAGRNKLKQTDKRVREFVAGTNLKALVLPWGGQFTLAPAEPPGEQKADCIGFRQHLPQEEEE